MNHDWCPRRDVLKTALGLCAAPLLPAQDNPASERPKEGDLLVRVGDQTATPLTPADIKAGVRQTMAFPMDRDSRTVRNGSRLNRILLVRLDAEKLAPETSARAAESVVAYSALCSHSGCEIANWIPEEQALFCPCHASKFAPGDGAKVLDGPAPRPLPALPLKVADGKLTVAQPFTARITFEQAG
jgi:Rieske Fe-S protein